MMAVYMVFWAMVMLGLLGIGRLRNGQQWVVAVVGTALILMVSQTLFAQLSIFVGVAPLHGFVNPVSYLDKGLLGWMALLIMPCGWLAPILSLNMVRRWQQHLSPAELGF
jgi:hypothetical protein